MIVHTDTCFTLHTAHTSYQMAVGPGGALLHTYYGPRLPDRALDLTDGRCPHDDPGCVVGAHFSAVPNHCNGHLSTTEARMAAALSGTFGFELDLTAFTPEQLDALRPYVAWYRDHGALLRSGDLYRLCPPDAGSLGAAWMIAAHDGSEAAVFAVGDVLGGAHGPAGTNSLPRLPLQGLDAALYEDEDGARYTGCQLMTLGLPLPGPGGQTPACIWYLRRAATCQDDKKG